MSASTETGGRRRRVEELPLWIHTIDLGDGLVTPGLWPPESRAGIASALERIDLQGKKVLDIGCLDGFWSFEAERRGASAVYATDLTSQARPDRKPYFRLAKELLGSNVQYFPDLSVFEVSRLGVTDFDVVLYLGVYYHLRDPLLSFTRLRQVMREGALLLVEGQAIDSAEAYARFFYEETFQADRSNWWVPTIPCLQQWIECSFFSVEEEHWLPHPDVPTLANTGRHVIRARAESRVDPRIACPEEELKTFDLNEYE